MSSADHENGQRPVKRIMYQNMNVKSKPAAAQSRGGLLQIETAGGPRLGLGFPPSLLNRMGGRTFQRFQVRREGADESLVFRVRSRGKAEHGMRAGDRAVRFDVGAHIDFGAHARTPSATYGFVRRSAPNVEVGP
jgi:hypothetical protein